MTLDEVKAFYGSFYRLCKSVGFSQTSTQYWKKIGGIPLASQARIERCSGGALKLRIEDVAH